MGKGRYGAKFNDQFPFNKLDSLMWVFGALGIGDAVPETFRVSILESLLPNSLCMLWSQNRREPLWLCSRYFPWEEVPAPAPSVFSWNACLPVKTGQFFSFKGKKLLLASQDPKPGRTVEL